MITLYDFHKEDYCRITEEYIENHGPDFVPQDPVSQNYFAITILRGGTVLPTIQATLAMVGGRK